ncbi:MAG: hypothetical protein K2X38_04005 [Gemmataceae bacterium]|nr:hypothetical protein [Gemmataceae bacterium]
MFGQRTLLGLGSIALGVAGFQAPAQAGGISFGLNLNLGPQHPAYASPVRAPFVAPAVPAQVIQPTYYQPSHAPTYAPTYAPAYAPAYSPSHRLPTPAFDNRLHNNNFGQSNWRQDNNRPH